MNTQYPQSSIAALTLFGSVLSTITLPLQLPQKLPYSTGIRVVIVVGYIAHMFSLVSRVSLSPASLTESPMTVLRVFFHIVLTIIRRGSTRHSGCSGSHRCPLPLVRQLTRRTTHGSSIIQTLFSTELHVGFENNGGWAKTESVQQGLIENVSCFETPSTDTASNITVISMSAVGISYLAVTVTCNGSIVREPLNTSYSC